MSTPRRWAAALLRWLAPDGHADDVIGDLNEMHGYRVHRYGRVRAEVMTIRETVDMAAALVRARVAATRGSSVQDYKLGLRMLVKYPGLTVAGGLALAIAIGIGAAWFDLSNDLFRPRIPLPEGDRIVEIEMRNLRGGGDERRIAHDFLDWRRDLRTVEELGAYRTLERNVIVDHAPPQPMTVAEITASAFQMVRVPPLIGRPLLASDERPGAPRIVVLGYRVWQLHFGGRTDVVGQTVRLGSQTAEVVGVMPEGFAFPINHRLWVPLPLSPEGYAPLEGPPIRVFGRLAPDATQAQANTEIVALVERTAAASPRTHEYLRPRVLAYGGESPGDRPLLEVLVRHLPILLVLIVACANVGTLIYARTATRGAEIAVRHALGASRARIVGQLFVEALVLASASAVVGLTLAHAALRWGIVAAFDGNAAGLPFWMNPGLKPTTVLYAAILTIAGAALLGVLPALKIAGSRVQSELRNLGAGGATLRFGKVWTTVMIAQVALTVIFLPPAVGISHEAIRDHLIREPFPDEQYLAVEVEADGEETLAADDGARQAFSERRALLYAELERQVAREPGVVAITFADRLPGMAPGLGQGEFEPAHGQSVVRISTLWMAAVGRGYFEAFDGGLVAGRDFHEGDRMPGARTVLVNEAFARRYSDGASPVGRRVRFGRSDDISSEPWFEIVGMVRDIGMTPTDLGEAPYVFQAASAAATSPLVMGIRTAGDPATLAPQVRTLAARIDPRLRVDQIHTLDELTWRQDVPGMVAAGTIAFVVALGLFLSAAGIFALMSVSVSRRTREIGLRSALGASSGRVLAGIFSRALVLIGSGIAAGNGVLLLFIALNDEVDLAFAWTALLGTSIVLLVVGLLACVEPARRALRIQPMDALREA